MKNKKNILIIISLILTISLSLSPDSKSINLANAQSSPCDNRLIMPSSVSNAIPVILIHGYNEDSNVWLIWEQLLSQNNIPFCTVSFHQSNDECGSAVSHAIELAQIVQQVKDITGQDKVNIVAHSKGGLDARVYLANTNTQDVANLIMIGTPNGGDPLADLTVSSNVFNPWFYFLQSYFCTPALYDLETTAEDTKVRENTNTNYYTIYGDWNPDLPCSFYWFDNNNYNYLGEPNDGIVPKSSVLSLANHYTNYINLGSTSHCHQDLFGGDEYNLTQSILKGR